VFGPLGSVRSGGGTTGFMPKKIFIHFSKRPVVLTIGEDER
jgi:hypothetical protein